MKLWKCDPYLLETKGFVLVVVMAETRQQAIEKASARLLEVLDHMFPDDDYRQFAQLGSDNLGNTIEEVPEEVVITIVEPPSVGRDLELTRVSCAPPSAGRMMARCQAAGTAQA